MATDTLTITSNGKEVSTWEEFTVTRGIESMPSCFTARVTEQKLNGQALDLRPFQPFTAKLGKDLVITGYLDDFETYSAPGVHGVIISGRSRCQDFVDCSAEIAGNTINSANVQALATELAKPYGITVTMKDGPGRTLLPFSANIGATPYSLLEPIAAYSGFLVYDDTAGNIVLARLAEGKMASGFAEGINIETISVRYSGAQRFSDYEVYWQALDGQQDIGSANLHGKARDEGVGRNRKLKIVSDQMQDGQDIANVLAAYHMQRRRGRSQQARITCSTWRDSAGKLWQPNYLARINAPKHKLPNQEWLIAAVTYSKGRRGTSADLVLMPQEAFTIQPVNPYAFDWVLQQELAAARRGPQGEAP